MNRENTAFEIMPELPGFTGSTKAFSAPSAAPRRQTSRSTESGLEETIARLCSLIEAQGTIDDKVNALNAAKVALHKVSPFEREPVDCVLWLPGNGISANDYNPNSVAPPEMRLLERSILEDGYTQPIVGWKTDEATEVVDGFHRNRVGKESEAVKIRVHGYLPVALINADRHDLPDRMAATIRHNRARGKHKVEAMSDIVIELKRRNWSDEKIALNLGMDADEVLRLCQISGLAEMFADTEFSDSWDLATVEVPPDVVLSEEQA